MFVQGTFPLHCDDFCCATPLRRYILLFWKIFPTSLPSLFLRIHYYFMPSFLFFYRVFFPFQSPLHLLVACFFNFQEVGSIIGKKGELVRQLREEVTLLLWSIILTYITNWNLLIFCWKSGSRIHISDGSSADRIVTVTGNLNAIYKAFSLITAKVQEVSNEYWINWRLCYLFLH